MNLSIYVFAAYQFVVSYLSSLNSPPIIEHSPNHITPTLFDYGTIPCIMFVMVIHVVFAHTTITSAMFSKTMRRCVLIPGMLVSPASSLAEH